MSRFNVGKPECSGETTMRQRKNSFSPHVFVAWGKVFQSLYSFLTLGPEICNKRTEWVIVQVSLHMWKKSQVQMQLPRQGSRGRLQSATTKLPISAAAGRRQGQYMYLTVLCRMTTIGLIGAVYQQGMNQKLISIPRKWIFLGSFLVVWSVLAYLYVTM